MMNLTPCTSQTVRAMLLRCASWINFLWPNHMALSYHDMIHACDRATRYRLDSHQGSVNFFMSSPQKRLYYLIALLK